LLRILMGGFSNELGDWLKHRLDDVCVELLSDGNELRGALARDEVSLLLLDHQWLDGKALSLLKEIRSHPWGRELPVLYYLSQGTDGSLTRKLVRELGVREVLLPPLDIHELARKTSEALGLPLTPAKEDADQKIQSAIADVRNRFMGSILERVGVLEGAGVGFLEGNWSPDLREKAEREAHKLAGLLGTLGFPAGSRFAAEIEKLLRGGTHLSETQALRFSELVVALRLDIEKIPVAAPAEVPISEKRSSLLIVDRDADLAERLEAEAGSRGFGVRTVADLAAARESVSKAPPDVVLLDLVFSGQEEEGWALLEELSRRTPAIPTMVLTSRGEFTDRVEVARRGGRGFISKFSSPSQIIEAVTKLVDRLRASDARIMAVDDDPQVLGLLRALLEPRRVSILTLDDPLQFWERFEAFAPHLLLLDVEMPHLSGVELCRVVRNDTRWGEVPILFLTRHNDPETIHRVFSAGADDFVAKPIVGPELLTRIFNRLERVRLQRSISEIDPLTGALNRRKSSQMLADFIDLAKRHNQPFCLAIVDVEHLRKINDERGHAAGDRVLETISRRFQKAFRSEDILARWNSDEFVVGMYGMSRYDGVERLRELLDCIHRETFEAPCGSEFRATLNAGVAQFLEDGMTLDELHKSAEKALASARTLGGGRIVAAGSEGGSARKSNRVDVTLVMRDEAQSSLLLHTLESRGYRTRWLRDGKAANKLLAGPHPALHSSVVVLDVDLPGLDGLAVLKKLAWDKVLSETRVIMLTAPSVANEAQAALELGAFDYVAKPFNPPVVIQHIRRAFEAF
jgi:diguanylate cyclase (GGDEF)-like protein